MNHHRLTHSAALGLAVAALAAPTAAAQQDMRSPDTRDAARAAEAQHGQLRGDLRSPDTRDMAEGRGTLSAPEVTVVKVTKPTPRSTGFDWGDAGIGAGGTLGLILLASGAVAAVVHRRHSPTAGRPAAV